MSRSILLIALTLAAIAAVPREASALLVPPAMAEQLCQGSWVYNMNAGVKICAYCQKIEGKPRCDYFVCDAHRRVTGSLLKRGSPGDDGLIQRR